MAQRSEIKTLTNVVCGPSDEISTKHGCSFVLLEAGIENRSPRQNTAADYDPARQLKGRFWTRVY